MKKYLTKGALALVLGGCLASCSHEEDFSGSIVENKLQTYEKVFKEEFGTISPTQDWGFRTVPSLSRTRTANPNGNQWADTYTVPGPITDAELQKVLAVFNQQGQEKYTSLIDWDTFFVQQVWKGTATYTDSAGQSGIVGSDKMNWLFAVVNGQGDHINNFNAGDNHDYNGIMLMENSSTQAFGFSNSNGQGRLFQNFRMEEIDGNYYVGFDFESWRSSEANRNEGVKRDYIYNDWIVKIVKGVGKSTPGTVTPDETTIPLDDYSESSSSVPVYWKTETYKKATLVDFGRVFCEDLGQISSSDLDFNDVVFDAYIYEEIDSTITYEIANNVEIEGSRTVTISEPRRYATVVVLAAGGTLPLSIANKEVHDLFNVDNTSTLVNTAFDETGAYSNPYVTRDPVFIDRIDGINAISDIDIIVKFSHEALQLEAKEGNAPHMFCVPEKIPWALERIEYAIAYPSFGAYVSIGEKFWEGDRVAASLHNIEYEPLDEVVVTPGDVTVATESHRTIDGGTTSTGGYQGEEVLIRVRN